MKDTVSNKISDGYSSIAGPLKEIHATTRTVVRKQVVCEGDLVVLFESFDSMEYIVVRSGEYWSGRQGSFKVERLIGLPFGSRIKADSPPGGARKGRVGRPGWIVVLQPSPQLWTVALSHRTQIIYQADISLIIMNLEVKPGSIIYESGTGSGSLSTSFCEAIAPNGHLNTFEFNEQRVKSARKDFEMLAISHLVTVRWRNVVEKGLSIDPKNPDQDKETADAVFLDLPCPWLVAESAFNVLKAQGMICTFSPCIEQVQNTCDALKASGFVDLLTVENLLRTFEARDDHFPLPVFSPEDQVEESEAQPEVNDSDEEDCSPDRKKSKTDSKEESADKRKKTDRRRQPHEPGMFITKPFPSMRGHTSYLTFARKPPQSFDSQN